MKSDFEKVLEKEIEIQRETIERIKVEEKDNLTNDGIANRANMRVAIEENSLQTSVQILDLYRRLTKPTLP